MLIQPVSLLNYCPAQYKNTSTKKNNSSVNYQADSFQSVSFKGLEKTIEEAAKKTFKTDKEVEKVFTELVDNIISDTNIFKIPEFKEIQKVYQRSGFRGLLHELWNANPEPAILKLREKAEEAPIALATKNESPLFEIFSFGRHGFLNLIFGNKNATHDVKLTIRNPKSGSLLDFSLDKKGNCELFQSIDNHSVYNVFYRETGNIKQRTVHGYGAPESTYFTKDGVEGGLDQFLYGGPAIPIN